MHSIMPSDVMPLVCPPHFSMFTWEIRPPTVLCLGGWGSKEVMSIGEHYYYVVHIVIRNVIVICDILHINAANFRQKTRWVQTN